MANQFDLFTRAPPKSHHAKKINAGAHIVRMVNTALKASGKNGLTAEEAGDHCGLEREQAQSALSELCMFGNARRLEAKRTSRKGGLCTVYLWIKN